MSGGEFLENCTSFPHKRVRTPTVIQMEVVECGAASLSIILSHYKCFVPLEELRIACGISSNGSTAFNVLKAAKSYGMDAKAYKKGIEALISIKPPFIIFWNFNHFLVVEGFCKKGVYLNDPASGPRLCSFEEFARSYTGVVISCEKGEKFQPRGHPPNAIKVLWSRLTTSTRALWFLGLAQLLMLVPGLSQAAFTTLFIDKILIDHQFAWKWGLIAVMSSILLFQVVINWLQGTALYRLNAYVASRMATKFIHHVLRLPINFYQQRSSGDLAQRVQLNDEVINAITHQVAHAVLNVGLMVFYGVVMFHFSAIIAGVAFAAAAANAAMLYWINRTRTDAMHRLLKNYFQTVGYSVGGLQNMATIKSLGMETDFFAEWAGYNTQWIRANQEFGAKSAILGVLSPAIQMLTTASLMGVGAFAVMQGSLSIGMLMGLHVIMKHFLAPLSELVDLGKTLQEVKVKLLRLDDTLNNPLDPLYYNQEAKAVDRSLPSKLKGHLEMRAIRFGYNPTAAPIIDDFNLELQSGHSVAFVGASGCGKSTIGKLITGLYHCWDGELLYDGRKRSEYPPGILHNSLSVVDQDIMLFSGSIRDNITLWNVSIPEEEIVQAAKDACIHDKVMLRNGGYDAILEEGGANLSGGERQRLEIARALVLNPSILVLDEATSALDSVTEATIMRNIKRRGCTLIIVAHRLSTIRDCDQILVLEAGTVIESGSHTELKERPGLYHDLYKADGATIDG